MTVALVDPPPAASAREYLRGGLPALYHDDELAMRFLAGLETVLDPIVALVDSLHAHFDVRLGPGELVMLICAWLGLEPGDALDADPRVNEQRHRALALAAPRLMRTRGTKAGLQELLQLAFPQLGIKVEDHGRSTAAAAPQRPRRARPPAFTVVTRTSEPAADVKAVLERTIRRNTPVNVQARLKLGRDGKAEVL